MSYRFQIQNNVRYNIESKAESPYVHFKHVLFSTYSFTCNDYHDFETMIKYISYKILPCADTLYLSMFV